MTIDGDALPMRPRGRRGTGRSAGVFGVAGELLVTAGVLVLLYLGWQLWLNDLVVGAQQNGAAGELSESWSQPRADRQDGDAPVTPVAPATPGEPVVSALPAYAEEFAVLIVPRWGADYKRTIAEGIGQDVLNHLGIGHYPTTQMPGELGNFAIAAHRTTRGAALQNVHQLRVGDNIYVETKDGWYAYIFRGVEYVLPTGVGVVEPVPQHPGVAPTDRYITMTTCNPIFSTAERIIAYGVYDNWYPRQGGPPDEIAATVMARSN